MYIYIYLCKFKHFSNKDNVNNKVDIIFGILSLREMQWGQSIIYLYIKHINSNFYRYIHIIKHKLYEKVLVDDKYTPQKDIYIYFIALT